MMNSWKTVPLIALADYINGYAFKPEDHTDEGLPIIRIEQLKDDSAELDHYDKSVPEYNLIHDGDLIFSWSASLFLRIWDRGDAILNQHLFKVIPFPDVDKQYLKYCIEYNLPKLSNSSHGSTMKHITRKELKRFHVSLPSEKTEQAKIAEVLATIDRAIAQTEALIAKHQRIKTGLMQDLLTRGIDEHGQLRDPSTHRFKSTPLGMIPEEWEVKKVVDLSTQVTDGDHLTPRRSDSGVYLVSARNILNDGLDLSNVDYVDEKEYAQMIVRCHPEVGDVLISCSGSVGRVCLVPENLRLALVRSVALIKFKKTEYLPEFSKWVMQSHLVQVQIAQSQKQAAQPNLFQDPIKKLLIPVPNPDEQKRIAEKISSTDAVIKSEFGNLSKLNRLKTGLMQDLLSGRVPVKPLME